MKYETGLPIVISPAILACNLALLMVFPQTFNPKKNECMICNHARPAFLTFLRRVRRYIARHIKPQGRWSRLRAALVSAIRTPANREIVQLLPGAAAAFPLVIFVMGITMRYFSVRFDWPLWLADKIPVMYAGYNLLVLLVHIPVMSLVFCQESSRDRDLILARFSIALLFVGQMMLAFGQDMLTAVFGQSLLMLGTCLPSFCRAALSRIVPRSSSGKLFGFLATFELLAYLFWDLEAIVFQYTVDFGLDTDGKLTQHALVMLRLILFTPAVLYATWGLIMWRAKLEGQDANAESLIWADFHGEPLQDMRHLSEGRVTIYHASLVNPAMAF